MMDIPHRKLGHILSSEAFQLCTGTEKYWWIINGNTEINASLVVSVEKPTETLPLVLKENHLEYV